jgi:hypothetical protein
VAYVYFDDQDQVNQTAEKVAASFLRQLLVASRLDQLPPGLESAYNEFDEKAERASRPDLSAFINLFIATSKQFSIVSVLFDAYDECGRRQQGQIQLLIRRFLGAGIRVYITTWHYLREHLRNAFPVNMITIEVSADSGDVENYISTELKNESVDMTLRPKIITTISAKARGMYVSCTEDLTDRTRFLLAKFQLEYVLKEEGLEPKAMALTSLPATETDAYNGIMKRIGELGIFSSRRAFRTLSWILHAKRPLQIQELCGALEFQEDTDSLDEAINYGQFADEIVKSCKSLVVHEESSEIMRFAHTTVQEFLRTQNLPLDRDIIAKVCLKYLALDVFSKPCINRESMTRHKRLIHNMRKRKVPKQITD